MARNSTHSKSDSTAFVGYVPVMSSAYERLFQNIPEPRNCHVLGRAVLNNFPHLRKDIRALEPTRAAQYIEASGYFGSVLVAEELTIVTIPEDKIYVPDDELVDFIITHLPYKEVVRYSPFLRWDRKASMIHADPEPDKIIRISDIEDWVLPFVAEERLKATNWWRWVASVARTSDGTIIGAHNHHLPTQFSPTIDGDLRMNFRSGGNLDMTTDMHAEATLISKAARDGVSLLGAEIYVSTFPCPNCAKLIACSGIRTCFYIEGYSMGDGLEVLRSNNVELIKVETKPFTDPAERLVPY